MGDFLRFINPEQLFLILLLITVLEKIQQGYPSCIIIGWIMLLFWRMKIRWEYDDPKLMLYEPRLIINQGITYYQPTPLGQTLGFYLKVYVTAEEIRFIAGYIFQKDRIAYTHPILLMIMMALLLPVFLLTVSIVLRSKLSIVSQTYCTIDLQPRIYCIQSMSHVHTDRSC